MGENSAITSEYLLARSGPPAPIPLALVAVKAPVDLLLGELGQRVVDRLIPSVELFEAETLEPLDEQRRLCLAHHDPTSTVWAEISDDASRRPGACEMISFLALRQR